MQGTGGMFRQFLAWKSTAWTFGGRDLLRCNGSDQFELSEQIRGQGDLGDWS